MFKNEAFLDFTIPEIRDQFEGALDFVDVQIKAHRYFACSLIDGRERSAQGSLKREDPSNTALTIGTVGLSGNGDADDALASVRAGQPSWEDTPVERRAEILRAVASRMRNDKMKLAALIIREVGKTWREADADVAEAIDFCDYYAEEALRMAPPRKTQDVPGEENLYFYQPRGVCVVISPWNFPLAIACGMAVAALVTGNTVVLKPAEQSSLIAFQFAKILLECGVPTNAFALVTGLGEVVGRRLVSSPLVDMVCFTGSKSVGLEIIRTASDTKSTQNSIKKVVAELGGKNAIIVDEDADLDEAVKGILHSAFGFAGQKCSACSRVIAVGSSYEPLMGRLRDAAADLIVGEASESSSFFGPVVDEEAQQRILSTISSATNEATLLFKGDVPKTGHYVPPTIFRDVKPTAAIWRDEIFGPVVGCTRAESFEVALGLANDSQYALTGGIFSRNPKNIAAARRRFKVGNLYINRACTGALVCRQPFGGFKMSGVGSKAGGPDYLLQFVEPRTVTENTLRRGFAPE